MKSPTLNIVLVVVLILLILLFDVLTEHTLYQKVETVCSYGEQFIQYVSEENYEKARITADKMKAYWADHSEQLSMYIDHSDIEIVGINIETMHSYFLTKSYFDSIAEANKAISRAQDILKREKLTIENIL